eukprot:GHVU01191367.1.p3 GENE.GHVU01191367.1~~GHVU01191367.1.p3  ORF type:complete len:109 (-),score=23.28 GHVU01191367.1:120-446(-)
MVTTTASGPKLDSSRAEDTEKAKGRYISNAEIANYDTQIEALFEGKPMGEKEVAELCTRATEILREEGNVQPVNVPVTVVGDIHGQFYDLKEMFQIAGSKEASEPARL